MEKSLNGTNFSIIATRPAGSTNYTDTLLTPSTKYYYRIAAFNAGGPSAYTANISIFTSAPALPAVPTGLTATAGSGPRIDLKWTDTANNDEGFKIERSLNGTNFSGYATAPVNSTAWSDTSVSGSTKYYYRVRAFNGHGTSSPSNTASATTP